MSAVLVEEQTIDCLMCGQKVQVTSRTVVDPLAPTMLQPRLAGASVGFISVEGKAGFFTLVLCSEPCVERFFTAGGATA